MTAVEGKDVVRRAAIAGLGVALALLGAFSIWSGDFAFQWQPVASDLPHRGVLAAAVGVIEVVIGLGFVFVGQRRAAAIAMSLVFGFWTLLHAPSMVAAPTDVLAWLGVAEPGAIALAALLAAYAPSALSPPLARICVALFGAALVVFGLSHFVYASFTASMVPSYFPMRLGLTYFTGAAHAAAGLALIAGIVPSLAASLEALMAAGFTVLVNAPGVITHPQSRLNWTMLLVSAAITCSALLVARCQAKDNRAIDVETR